MTPAKRAVRGAILDCLVSSYHDEFELVTRAYATLKGRDWHGAEHDIIRREIRELYECGAIARWRNSGGHLIYYTIPNPLVAAARAGLR